MTRRDLTKHLTIRFNLPRRVAAEIVSEVFSWLATAIEADGRLELRGFGVFRIVERAPCRRRDIRRGRWIEVPAKRALTFRQSHLVGRRLNSTMTAVDGQSS